jgi:hypothetical protein
MLMRHFHVLLQSFAMAPTLKRKLGSFKQWALMFSSRKELTTQALENIQSGRPAAAMRSDASTSGEQGVSCNGVSSLLNDINADTATDRCPKAVAPPSKKSRPRYVQASNLTLRSLFRCQFLLCQCLSQISPSSTSVALGELPTYLPFFVFHVGWMYCRFGECKVQALSLVQLHAVTDLACNSFIQTSVCRNVDFEVSVVLAGSLGYRQL